MSIEIHAGASVPRPPFNAIAAETEAAAAKPAPVEAWLMIFSTLVGVLAASSLGVWVYLS